MKTIVIFYSYYKPHVGGIERYSYNLAKELTNKGNKVIVVTSNYDRSLPELEKCNEATIYRFDLIKDIGHRYPITKINNLKDIFSELSQLDIDLAIVQARFYWLSIFASKFTKQNHIPTICIDHGNAHLTIQNKILDRFGAVYEHHLTNKLKKYVDHFYAVSDASLKWLEHFNIKGEGVLYNSINADDINNKLTSLKKPNNKIVLTFAGRLIKDKGVIELIEAFNLLCKTHKNLFLNIIGDGALFNEVKKLSVDNSLIKVWGNLSNDEVLDIVAKSHIFVNPSRAEGMPTSILEAGALKCAVVATPVGGTTEIIPNENFGLYCGRDSKSIKECVDRLINDKDIISKLGNNLNDRICNNFTWDKIAKKIINIADNLS